MAGQSKLAPRREDLAKAGVFGVYLSVQLAGLLLASASQRQRQETHCLNSTAVTLSEVIKVVVSLIGIAATERLMLGGLMRAVYQTLLREPQQLLKAAVPALLYTIQNNVIYASLASLDALTFQTTYQLKLVASLLATRLLLKKPVAYTRWLSVVLLTLGVVSVHFSLHGDDGSSAGAGTAEARDPSAGNSATEGAASARSRSRLVGILGVLVACCCSGLAGAGMEMLFKNSAQPLPRRNLQVRHPTCPFVLCGGAHAVTEQGPLRRLVQAARVNPAPHCRR
jgi:UDP-sugar transporter A1/2/3